MTCHRAELRVTIQRVSGDAWRLDVLEERNGTAQIRVVLDGK